MGVAAVAVLNYALAIGARPRVVSAGPLAPERPEGWLNDPHEVDVLDARRAGEAFDLDGSGFVLIGHACPVGDFFDDHWVRARYLAEIEGLVQAMTGARRVVAFDWTRRASLPSSPTSTAVGAPVLRVHNDFTPRSAAATLRLVLREDSETLLHRRHAILSVWRPIRRAVGAWPLALLDARGVAEADLIVVQRSYPDGTGEIGFLSYRPTHRWYTFPRMQSDEIVVFKLFDSALGAVRSVPHSAFCDPTSPADAPPRESIEVRVLALH